MYRSIWGFVYLNSRIAAVFIDRRDVTSCIFQRAEHKEGRGSTMTEETQNSTPTSPQKVAYYLFEMIQLG